MLVRNIKEFKKLTYKKKLICFDYGKKKIGVAISDENHKISMPMCIILKNKEYKKKIKEIIYSYNIGGIFDSGPLIRKNFDGISGILHNSFQLTDWDSDGYGDCDLFFEICEYEAESWMSDTCGDCDNII